MRAEPSGRRRRTRSIRPEALRPAAGPGPRRPPRCPSPRPRATARTRSTAVGIGRVAVGQHGPQPAPDGPSGERHRRGRRGPWRRSGRASAARSSSRVDVVPGEVGEPAQQRARRRARRRRRAAAAPRVRTRLRRKRGSALEGSCTGTRPSAGAEGVRLGPAQPQERVAASGRMAATPSRPGAAQQGEQHRLGLVVGGVAVQGIGAEHRRAARPGRGPRGRRRAPPRPAPARKRGTRTAPRRRATTSASVAAAGPQPVVDVDRRDVEAGVAGQHEQRERVGPARDGARHRAGRREGAAAPRSAWRGVHDLSRRRRPARRAGAGAARAPTSCPVLRMIRRRLA